MFDRYTDSARTVITEAHAESVHLGADCIDTLHLLAGCIRKRPGVGAAGVAYEVLTHCGFTLEAVRNFDRIPGRETYRPNERPGEPVFTFEAKQALEFALLESLALGHKYIGAEHLLLGILRCRQCNVADFFMQHHLEMSIVSESVLERLPRQSSPAEDPPAPVQEAKPLSLEDLARRTLERCDEAVQSAQPQEAVLWAQAYSFLAIGARA
jgi:ATP-dependent Clp protease ATP-binding subunit ClpC